MTEAPAALVVDGVQKTFRIPVEQVHTLKERVMHPLRRSAVRELAALRDISFTVQKGEFFGIVGRNGSGKSTLLKCMAGIYATDRGRIYVDGRLSTFIELGVGFNPDLPARDNVLLNATMLGLSPREARRRLDGVIDFAELHDFVELKLKNYSSGMLVRLAFAVMIQVDADVLLIDEVLAVGDASFQQKCYDEFGSLRRRGKTVVLVTHDMIAAQRFCDRGMLLERGGIVELGEVQQVANRYLELNFGGTQDHTVVDGDATDAADEPAERYGDGRARIVEAWFEDDEGTRTSVIETRTYCVHAMRVVFAEDVMNPAFTMILEAPSGAVLFTADEGVRDPTGLYRAGEEVVVRTRFLNVLAPDRYLITPTVADGGGVRVIDRPVHLQRLTVSGLRSGGGIIAVPFEMTLERSGGRAATAEEVGP